MTDADSKNNNLQQATCQSLAKPYLSARHAAEVLGCTTSALIEDINENRIGSVIGGEAGALGWFVPLWELQGERLDMHRKRLSSTSDLARIPVEAKVTPCK